ncbi:MAG: hypothetical protein ACRENV_01100, partial [Candidatus Dormibacteria bacterium]
AGLEGSADVAPVTHEEVLRVFAANIDRLRKTLFDLVEHLPARAGCDCAMAVPLPELAAP